MTEPQSSHHAVAGGCLCGEVRYRASGPSSNPTLCHCRTCRKAAGAPIVGWVTFPTSHFELVSGEPVAYQSSERVVRTFCGTCGTPLTYASDDHPGLVDVTTCSLDDPDALPPRDETWTSHRLRFMNEIGKLPSFPGKRGSS